MEYATNPSHRCSRCKAREVLSIENEVVIDTNLERNGEIYFCKNKEECLENVNAENTLIDMSFDEEDKMKSVSVFSNGKEVMSLKSRYEND